MKTDYIKLLCLLNEFKGNGVIPEKYLRELNQHIEFLTNEIANSDGLDKNKTVFGISKLFLFLYNLFKAT
jgi:hypothetical protein